MQAFQGGKMRVRVVLSLETELSVSIASMQSLFEYADLNVKVEGISMADMEDQRRAAGYCPDCGRHDNDEEEEE
jgi:hypothetical protein